MLKRNRSIRLLHRAILARKGGYPDWRGLIGANRQQWDEAVAKAKSGPNILIATSVGSHLAGTTLESLLGIALTLRGARVHFLLCDSVLPACLACDVTWYPNRQVFAKWGPSKDLCKHCFGPASNMFRSLGLQVHKYSDYLTPDDFGEAEKLGSELTVQDMKSFKLDGLAVGEHALAGALRFFATAALDDEPTGESVLRRYFKAALLTAHTANRMLKESGFEAAVFHHGIYVPQGIIGEVARRENVRVVNWNPAYRKKCFIFSHGDTYHHTLMSEPTEQWENMDWSKEKEDEVMSYLRSRWEGTHDWIWFHERPDFGADIGREIGLDPSRPCIGMLTNVMWDAQLHYPANAFPSMLDWAIETIRYFAGRPDLQLLIRVHPAEIRGTLPSRQPIAAEIEKAFPKLPDNVFIIPPESSISTYVAMEMCDSVIIYGTKTGVELTSMGIPVIVAGEAWIRNKGLTLDATSKDEYFQMLDRLPLGSRLDEDVVAKARKYAYHFFFRRMIPVNAIGPAKGKFTFRVRTEALAGLEDLAPGCCRGLDAICDGILHGSDFVHDASELHCPDKVETPA